MQEGRTEMQATKQRPSYEDLEQENAILASQLSEAEIEAAELEYQLNQAERGNDRDLAFIVREWYGRKCALGSLTGLTEADVIEELARDLEDSRI
jgi:flagellar biosynthesis/type III secretory pathway protein FliH